MSCSEVLALVKQQDGAGDQNDDICGLSALSLSAHSGNGQSIDLDAAPFGSSPLSSLALSFGRSSEVGTNYSSDTDSQQRSGSHCCTEPSGSESEAPHPSTFDPALYLALHRKACTERLKLGPGKARRMRLLYRYWAWFLPSNFNDAMYKSFVTMAQEDAAQGSMYGLGLLFPYYEATLTSAFDADLFADFERIAHRHHDYLGIDLGVRCLLDLLTEHGGEAAAAAAGFTLDPLTTSLLGAWREHQQREGEGTKDPRTKLHQRLAEKRSKRTKASRGRQDKAGPRSVSNPMGGGGAEGEGELGSSEPAGGSEGTPGGEEEDTARTPGDKRGPRKSLSHVAEGKGSSGSIGSGGGLTGSPVVPPSSRPSRPPRSWVRGKKGGGHHGGAMTGGGGGGGGGGSLSPAAQPWIPKHQHHHQQHLPDRLGDILGN